MDDAAVWGGSPLLKSHNISSTQKLVQAKCVQSTTLTHLIIFWREKRISMLTNNISPTLNKPRHEVSGLTIKKHNLHCLVKMSTSKMWSKLTSRHMSSLDLLRFLGKPEIVWYNFRLFQAKKPETA